MQSTTVLVLITIICLYYINTQSISTVFHSRDDLMEFQYTRYNSNKFNHLKKSVIQQQTIEAQVSGISFFQNRNKIESTIKPNPIASIHSERQYISSHDLQTEYDDQLKVVPHPNPPDPLPKAISLDSGNYTLKDFGTASINREIRKLSFTYRI